MSLLAKACGAAVEGPTTGSSFNYFFPGCTLKHPTVGVAGTPLLNT